MKVEKNSNSIEKVKNEDDDEELEKYVGGVSNIDIGY